MCELHLERPNHLRRGIFAAEEAMPTQEEKKKKRLEEIEGMREF